MSTDPLTMLSSRTTVDEAVLERLHGRLELAAARDGVLDVACRVVDSPAGPLLLAATDAGLVRLAYAVEDHAAVLDRLARDVSPRVLRAPARLDGTAHELADYFDGGRTSFDLDLDLRLAHGFRREVLHELRRLPYARTASYAAVAAAVGNPGAVRAVGTACATNPLPIVIPCHRVVRSDGSNGQYVGGPATKALLLGLEAATAEAAARG